METKSLLKIIILLLLCLAVHAFTSQAQTLYTTGSKITIAPNTTLTIKGSVENAGIIANDGHLKVAGPWVNSGTYYPGKGQVTFNSSSRTVPQMIHHNGQTFNMLTLAGGTKKIIVSDLVVAGGINFDDGVIELSGPSKITFDAGVDISGASDRSHIHGPVFHKGVGDKLFPIGNGLLYLPVELIGVRDPSATVGIRAFEFENLALAKPSSLHSISDLRYWHIDVTSGSLDGAQVVLPLRGESWISDPEEVVVVQSSAPTENFISIGQSSISEANYGRVASKSGVTMPFVALASMGEELTVYNAVSPNGDGSNDYLRIENIENYTPNKFSLFNRWGDKVFEVSNYDNQERAFRGRSNINGEKDLVNGTYFYVIQAGKDGLKMNGFLALKNSL